MIRSAFFALLFAFGLSSCAPDGTSVGEAEHSAKIVGSWIGTVGDAKETISFGPDGKFVSEERRIGFISTTLGQGVTSTVRGTWAIRGNVVTLNIDRQTTSASHIKPLQARSKRSGQTS